MYRRVGSTRSTRALKTVLKLHATMEEEAAEYVIERATPLLDKALTKYVPRAYAAAAAVLGSNVVTPDIVNFNQGESTVNPRRTLFPRRMSTKAYVRKRTKEFAEGPRKKAKIITTMPPSSMTITRRSRYKHNLGVRPRYQCNKYSFKSTKTNDTQDKTQYSIRLVKIPYNSDDTLFNSRNGRLVNVRGVRFQWVCKWKDGQATNEPIQIRWAVINPKENTGATSDINNNNWWVSLSPANEYAVNFSSSADWFDLMTRGINQKKWGVLKEGTFLLGPAETAAGDTRTTWRQQKIVQFYVRLNQQMKWGTNGVTDADAFPNANIHFVWWYCKRGTLDTTQSFTTAGNVPIETEAQVTNFFKTANGLM